jgi:hypothetical protein
MTRFLTTLAGLFALAGTSFAQDYSLSATGWVNGPSGTSTYTGTQNIQAGPNYWAISPYTGSTMVGLVPTDPTASYNNMTNSLGMSASSVTALSGEIAAQNPSGGGNITNGSWTSKDFSFTGPAKFSMYWIYTSTDYVPFNDGSITTLVNTTNPATTVKINGVTTQYLLLGATNPGTGNYSTGSYGSTGWQIVNYEITVAGTYRLGFASFNQGDTALSPILYVNDGLGSVTLNGQPFASVAPNDPNMPDINNGGGGTPKPTVVSTAPGPDTVTIQTVPGVIIKAQSESRGTPVVTLSYADVGFKGSKTFDVTRTTTQVTKTPVTIVDVTTTPITIFTTTTPSTIKTWSDGTTTTENGSPVTTSEIVNQVVTETKTITDVDTKTSSETKSAASDGIKNAVAFRNNSLYTGNPLDRKDGAWIEPYFGASRISSTMKAQGLSMGHQITVGNNTAGIAVDVAKAETGTKLGAETQSNSVAGVVYIMTKQEYLWYKGAVGIGHAEYKNSMTIPSFGLGTANKAKQVNVFVDNTFYSAYDYYGLRPFVGVLVNNSNIVGTESIGSPLLASVPNKGSTVYGLPYVGLRYEPIKDVSVEYRATKSPDFNTVHSVRANVNKKIKDNIYLNLSVGVDKGSKNYQSAVGMIGLVVKF